jgi:hypothetical protein
MTKDDVLSWYTGNPVYLHGYNNVLPVTFEKINNTSLLWAESKTANASTDHFITPQKVSVGAASAQDAAAGSGMRTLLLVGCCTRGCLQYETIILGGNTETDSVLTYRFIYGMYGLTFGTSGCNEGIVYCAGIAATFTTGNPATPEECLTIQVGSIGSVGQNMATNPVFMVPPGERYRLSNLRVGAAVQPIVVLPRVRLAGYGLVEVGGWMDIERISIGSAGTFDYPMDIILDAGDIIRFDALSTTAAGQVSIKARLDKIRPA